jgi:stage IV sporulation protein FB
MDSDRVLRAVLASRMGFVRATECAASIGLFHNSILVFVAIFVYLAATSEAHSVALRAVSRGVPRDDDALPHATAGGSAR